MLIQGPNGQLCFEIRGQRARERKALKDYELGLVESGGSGDGYGEFEIL